MRTAVRVFVLTVVLAAGWGLLEASFLFLTKFQLHVPAASGVNLLVAGIVTYGALGILAGLLAAAVRIVLAVLPVGRNLAPLPFVLAVLVAGFGALVFGLELRRGPLQDLARGHWLLIVSLVGTAAIASVAGVLLYRLGARLDDRMRVHMAGRPQLARRLVLGAAAVPLSFVLIGFGLTGLRKIGVLHQPEGARPTIQASTAGQSGDRSRPNVILITIETTRADHVNALGYSKRQTTPHLDELATRGALFTRAYSAAPWTIPSMASLFTSLYPTQHGVVDSGRALSSEAPTLAKSLGEAGYSTATFYSNNFASDPGYGFQENYGKFPLADPHYISPLSFAPFMIRGPHRDVMMLILRITFPRASRWYKDADRLNRAILQWIHSRPAPPFLLHVHYLDPHDPYFEHSLQQVQFDPRTLANRDSLVARYDGEIRFVDQAIGDLIAALEAAGDLENAVVIITSDHGEEFLDHGGWGHRHSLYSEQIHVPLIVIAPPRVEPGSLVSVPVTTVDVAPTILDLVGLESPSGFRGRSLMPMLEDSVSAPDSRSSILSQVSEAATESHSLIQGDWQLIRLGGPTQSSLLIDLTEKPGDQHDLSDRHPDLVRRLESDLQLILDDLETGLLPARTKELSPQELDQLRALGYLD